MPQQISVDGTLTAYENLMLFARLYDIPADERKKRISEILSFLNLEDHANALGKNFFRRHDKKTGGWAGNASSAKVLFLDEPTTGLDPIARQNVWSHLSELSDKQGTTIFFSTHYMEEADGVSDQVAIMNNGKIAAMGTVAELKTKTKKKNATLEDAFIFFTGNTIHETGNFREIRRTRQIEKRLG